MPPPLPVGTIVMSRDDRGPLPMQLTETDRSILALLRLDARRTVSEIAGLVGVSRTTVKDRIDLMRERGIIRRFTVELAEADAPDQHARAFFQLRLHRPMCKLVHATISGWPEVVGFWSTAGDLDAMVLVAAASAAEIDTLREKLGRHPEVRSLTTIVVLREWINRGSGLGGHLAKEGMMDGAEV